MDLTFWLAVAGWVAAALGWLYAGAERIERLDETRNADSWRGQTAVEKNKNHSLTLEVNRLSRELYRRQSNEDAARLLDNLESVPVSCEERAG